MVELLGFLVINPAVGLESVAQPGKSLLRLFGISELVMGQGQECQIRRNAPMERVGSS